MRIGSIYIFLAIGIILAIIQIVGISKEATAHFFNEDQYELKFGKLIEDSLISEPLKTYILSNYRLADFYGKTLLLLPSVKQKDTSYYDNQFYIREGTKTKHKKERDKTE